MVQQGGIKTKLTKSYISKNRYLSPAFKKWYLSIVEDITLPDTIIEKNLHHPHELILGDKLFSNSEKKIKVINRKVVICPKEEEILITNNKELEEIFYNINADSFYDLFLNLSPVSTGSLFLDSGTAPKFLFTKNDKAFVVVKVKDIDSYLNNYLTCKSLLKRSKFSVKVIDEIGIVKSKSKSFFISEFKGYDYETEVIEFKKPLQKEILDNLSKIKRLFEEQNLFFRDLSPRNTIVGQDGAIYLIDFDNLYDLNDCSLTEAYIKSLDTHRWCGDILDEEKTSLFTNISPSSMDLKIKSPSFESKFYGKKEVTLNEIKHLAEIAEDFEIKHNLFGFNVYGHQLGRFISDFWEENSEVALHKFLSMNKDKICTVRGILFVLSKVDQELLIRQKYGLNQRFKLLSEDYFIRVIEEGKATIDPYKVYNILVSETDFVTKYKRISHELYRIL